MYDFGNNNLFISFALREAEFGRIVPVDEAECVARAVAARRERIRGAGAQVGGRDGRLRTRDTAVPAATLSRRAAAHSAAAQRVPGRLAAADQRRNDRYWCECCRCNGR